MMNYFVFHTYFLLYQNYKYHFKQLFLVPYYQRLYVYLRL